MCEIGFHGDATNATPNDCLICACPIPLASNKYVSVFLNKSKGKYCGFLGEYGNNCYTEELFRYIFLGFYWCSQEKSPVNDFSRSLNRNCNSHTSNYRNEYVGLRCAFFGDFAGALRFDPRKSVI